MLIQIVLYKQQVYILILERVSNTNISTSLSISDLILLTPDTICPPPPSPPPAPSPPAPPSPPNRNHDIQIKQHTSPVLSVSLLESQHTARPIL